MMKDLQGNSISEASAEAVDYYNQAVSAFNIYTGDPFSLVNNAIEVSPHFAMAHVLEMQGRVTEGVTWMATREPYWSDEGNFFKVHNWWHRALYHQELGQENVVLSIYDNHIRHGNSTVALELVDASAILWRLSLEGVEVGGRWDELADCWQAHADGHSYTFNDWHAVMAYLGAGRDIDAGQVLKDCKNIKPGIESEMQQWTRQTTLPLIEGFIAFWRKDYQTAIERLYGARFIANSFGGSHAQRDIIDLTLIEAAIRAGQPELARALANERLALKPESRINWGFLERSKGRAVSGVY